MTIFNEEYFHNLPEDDSEALLELIQKYDDYFWEAFEEVDFGKSVKSLDEVYKLAPSLMGSAIEGAGVVYSFLTEQVGVSYPPPSIEGNGYLDICRLREYILGIPESDSFRDYQRRKQAVKFNDAVDKSNTYWNTGFSYTFSDADLKRVQQLINELREQVTSSELFEEDHRRRLLNRLEKLQAELHKKMSDLDRFWGFVGDAGVALGKFGKDSKPFVDRIREMTQIVWNTQSDAEKLPSSTPNPFQLENKLEEHDSSNPTS